MGSTLSTKQVAFTRQETADRAAFGYSGIRKLKGKIMSINRVAVLFILVLLTITANIHAQTPAAAQPSTVSSVTGSISPDGAVRIIAHG